MDQLSDDQKDIYWGKIAPGSDEQIERPEKAIYPWILRKTQMEVAEEIGIPGQVSVGKGGHSANV